MRKETIIRAAIALFTIAPATAGLLPRAASGQAHEHRAIRELEIIVEGTYKPSRIEVYEGERVRLKFVRKEYNGCTREVVFPKLDIKRELPPSKPVYIDLPALTAGEYEFKCGMNMIKGTLVVVRRQTGRLSSPAKPPAARTSATNQQPS